MRIRRLAPLAASLLTLSAAACGPAWAGDYYDTSPRYAPPPATPFSGAYIGAHVGAASAKSANPFAKGNSINLGMQAGYDMRLGPAVIGGEIEGSNLGGAERRVQGGKIKEKWRAAVKGRAGIALDRTLLYGTAGLAFTSFDGADGVKVRDGWKTGYLMGVGVEQAFSDTISVKVEYDYIRTPGLKTRSAFGRAETDIGSHTLKAGLNYRF
ncbi:outer membrane protein [Labrys neptuniae]